MDPASELGTSMAMLLATWAAIAKGRCIRIPGPRTAKGLKQNLIKASIRPFKIFFKGVLKAFEKPFGCLYKTF